MATLTPVERIAQLEKQFNDIVTVTGMIGRALTDLYFYGAVHFKLDEQGVEYKPMKDIIDDRTKEKTNEQQVEVEPI